MSKNKENTVEVSIVKALSKSEQEKKLTSLEGWRKMSFFILLNTFSLHRLKMGYRSVCWLQKWYRVRSCLSEIAHIQNRLKALNAQKLYNLAAVDNTSVDAWCNQKRKERVSPRQRSFDRPYRRWEEENIMQFTNELNSIKIMCNWGYIPFVKQHSIKWCYAFTLIMNIKTPKYWTTTCHNRQRYPDR